MHIYIKYLNREARYAVLRRLQTRRTTRNNQKSKNSQRDLDDIRFLKVNNGLLVGYGSSGRGLYAIVRFLDDLFFPPLYTASFVSLNAKLHQLLPKRKRQLTNDVSNKKETLILRGRLIELL